MNFLNTFFKIKERNSTIKHEIIGGTTTFLTMAYIIFINPAILSEAGMDKGALITVTILSATIGTLLAAFLANVPFALAPGMGLNAFFTYSLVIGRGIPWETALGIVFLSGVFFFILSIGGIRERIANAIPLCLKISVTGGIGLFIAFIGLKTLGIVASNPATIIGLARFNTKILIGIVGLFIAIILEIKKVKGGILIGIVTSTVIGFFTGDTLLPTSIVSMPPSIAPIAFKLDILSALKLSLLGPAFSFMFVDLFDSLGTLIACSKEIGIADKDGNVKDLGKMLYADVTSTMVGAVLGTSTVTTLSETAAGIAAGARTGLASVVTACFFIVSLFFTPLVSIVPSFATAPALIIVGVYMFKNICDLDWKDYKTLFPSFVTILMMPLTYSISTGLAFGFISYIVIHAGTGDVKKINPTLLFIGVLSVLSLIV
ncbi:NCS2 family permease [Cetobacterium sp. 8H]|uniref:NCS2 family permease n=1 Tax=Cetobacterium sp. 8H TaxID=2759681 RepID=UPI00163D2163|nr:NCS2 family permease [Cetobacterium sp. 8H]MBC2851209.1 NCS2 family permease [Cetobacterium sp. 8H]